MANPKLAKSRLQALLAMASGTVAEPVAGLAGLYGAATGGYQRAANNVDATRSALTYTPSDPRGLQEIQGALAPIASRWDALRSGMGNLAESHGAGPALSTAAYMVPDTLAALLGARSMGVKGPKLSQILERSEGPTMGAAQSQVGAIGAWHGSPHDFDQFSMDKLGTGEGAQAYGHGLYFAGAKDVAAQYRAQLAGDGFLTADGQIFNPSTLEHLNVRNAARSGDLDAAIARAQGLRASANAQTAPMIERDLATLQDLKARGGIRPNDGHLYNVELTPDEHDLLDWDAPLHQQPEKVQQAIAQTINSGKLEAEALREIQASHPDALTGKKLYTILQQSDNINNAAGASEHLNNLGIPGIRYLDGGSRAAGDGSRNYVMFDDKHVTIKGKE